MGDYETPEPPVLLPGVTDPKELGHFLRLCRAELQAFGVITLADWNDFRARAKDYEHDAAGAW